MMVTFGFREEDTFEFGEEHIKSFNGFVVVLFINLTVELYFIILKILHIYYNTLLNVLYIS